MPTILCCFARAYVGMCEDKNQLSNAQEAIVWQIMRDVGSTFICCSIIVDNNQRQPVTLQLKRNNNALKVAAFI